MKGSKNLKPRNNFSINLKIKCLDQDSLRENINSCSKNFKNL